MPAFPDPPGLIIGVGSRVRFKLGPLSQRFAEGKVLGWREDPRERTLGLMDIACDDGVQRTIAANGAELIW